MKRWTGEIDPKPPVYDRPFYWTRVNDPRSAPSGWMPQINEAESFGGECGECIRQQCWKDIIGLIDKLIPDLGRGVTGKGALTALKATLQAGIGTFGVADGLEAEHNRLSAVLPKPEVRS